MTLWSLIAFKTCAINCYGGIYILKSFTHKIKITKIYFLMYLLFLYLAFTFGNEISRQSISDNILPMYIIFNLLYMTAIAVFVFFKGGAKA